MESVVKNEGIRLPNPDALSRSKAISIELRKVARRARVPRPTATGGGGFRTRRTDRYYRLFFAGTFAALFLIPSVLAALYYSFIAADQYVAEARFSVTSGSQTGLEALSSISSMLNVGQSEDGQIIAEYVKSRTIVDEVQKRLDLRHIFNPGTYDLIAEAPKDFTIEEFVKYWKSQVKITVDRTGGLVTLTVRTFSPEDSLSLSKEIIAISERMVNRLTRRNQENALEEADRELTLSKTRLEKSVTAMRDARIAAGVLDVDLTAAGYTEIVTKLQISLSKLETQINSLTSSNIAKSPQLVPLQAQANALRQQIASYESRLTGAIGANGNTKALAAQAGVLSDRAIELSIAQDEYKMAVASYESARLSMEKQRSYLMVYVQPSLPEEAIYPRRFLMWATISAVAFLLWALVAGLAILVRDNTAA